LILGLGLVCHPCLGRVDVCKVVFSAAISASLATLGCIRVYSNSNSLLI
jgi:hypothetical protein